MRFCALSACLFLVLPTVAWADAGVVTETPVDSGVYASAPPRFAEPEIPKSEPPELAAEELNLGWTLLRTFVVLGLVVGLAYLTLNVGLRRLLGIRPVEGARIVTVIERVALDQKRSLFVIEAAGEVLLVGGGDGAMSLISKLDAAEVARLRASHGSQGAPSLQLSPLVEKLLGRKPPPPPSSNS